MTNKKSVAIIPSKGVGDGLMMMVAAHRLHTQGYNVVTFHDRLIELSPWFEGHHFARKPSVQNIVDELASFDLVILQNDYSDYAKEIARLYRARKIHYLSIFYPTYSVEKAFPLTALDRVFDSRRPMVENIARAISSLLGLYNMSKNNGLLPNGQYEHRLHKSRIVIHPSSSLLQKNWHPHKFITLALKLAEQGFQPIFCISREERSFWEPIVSEKFPIPDFATLCDLAAFVYESGYQIGNDSGTGHLASNLQIPNLIIADSMKRMQLWRPGWYSGSVVTPPQWIPNLKGSRLREKKWRSFISVKKVFEEFEDLVSRDF